MTGVYTNIAKRRIEQSKLSASSSIDNQSRPTSPAIQPTTKPVDPKMSTNHLSNDRNAGDMPLEKPEKYTTHLEPSLIKKLKIYATERDMKDYQVVKNALLLYFEKNI